MKFRIHEDWPWHRRDCLIVKIGQDVLTVLHVKDARGFSARVKDFPTRETPPEILRQSLSAWMDDKKAREVRVVFPRSEILQKEFSLAGGKGQDFRQELDQRLEQLLPFSVKEMAWGLRVEPEAGKMEGLLLAVPDQKIRELISFLADAGFENCRTDVVSEDQSLFWAALEAGEKGPVLVLERSRGRVLAVFIKNARLCFSRTYEIADSNSGYSQDWLSEVSLKLLESETKPSKILFAGEWDAEERARTAEHFALPSGALSGQSLSPNLENVEASLYGAFFSEKYPAISLLPREEKTRKRALDRTQLLRQILGTFAVLGALSVLFFTARLQVLGWQSARLDKEIHKIAGPAAEAEKMLASLRVINDARVSKESLLELLRDIAREMPADIGLRELRIENEKFLFRGESLSSGKVSEAVEMLEGTSYVEESKLRSTRLRKGQGQDILEFEVTGEWTV